MDVALKDTEPCLASGAFVISLDFELLWGSLPDQNNESHIPNVLGARGAIPKLLDLFEEYGLACTWATTGLLFFDRRDHMMAALPSILPDYDDMSLSSYNYLQFVGDNEDSDPLHFGLSLIRMIKDRPRQEIGTHTFSHYFCADAGENAAPFSADLEAAQVAAAKEGIKFTSIVFPRNQVCPIALDICADYGITAFRGNAAGWAYSTNVSNRNRRIKRLFRLLDFYLPIGGNMVVDPVVEHGMVNVAASCFLRPYCSKLAMLEPLRMARIKRAMRTAASRRKIFHLWCHPHNFGVNLDENIAFLRAIAEEALKLDREFGWPPLTMADVASRILSGEKASN